MIYLLLGIFCSIAIALVFKTFNRYGINLFNAIIINYWVCVITGSLAIGHLPIHTTTWTAPWLPYAGGLGILFISGFYWIGRSIDYFGITITTVLQRISLILPVSFAILVYHEPLNVGKFFGIICAMLALYLINRPNQQLKETNPITSKPNQYRVYYPILVFFVSGIIGILLQYVQKMHFERPNDTLEFTILLFGAAGSLGLLTKGYLIIRQSSQFQWKDVIAGIALGVPNFGTIYFLLKTFSLGWQGSVVFPLNDVGTIIGVSLFAYFVFQEKLSRWNWLGLGLAILAIVLVV